MTGSRAVLSGIDVLLVEDESLVSFLIEDMLLELGARSVRHASDLEAGFARVAEQRPGLAVLDVNLAGVAIFPLAEKLARDRVPILFTTGYGREGLGGAWADTPVLQKPLTLQQLESALRRALSAGRD